MNEVTAEIHAIPLCLISGGWEDIGHNSAIRLVKSRRMADLSSDGWALQHRFEGRVKKVTLSWLVDDRPLLRLALEKKVEKVVA